MAKPIDNKNINYYELMTSSLYNVIIPGTALYDKSAADICLKPTMMNNHGEMVTVEEEMIRSAISILAMIDIDKRGYRIAIINKSLIPEIVDTIYNHITKCIDLKMANPLGEFPVPEEDLLDMERFMLKVIEANPGTLVTAYSEKLIERSKVAGMRSRFDDITVTGMNKIANTDKFRRVSHSDIDSISFSDILNM